jgi:(p)ppGpp synthase/HD superfamily hydrolase
MHATDVFILNILEDVYGAHWGQWRKGSGVPYLIHPLEVTKRLGLWGISKREFPNVWGAALYHDVPEDTNMTIEDILVKTNSKVAGFVEELTFRGDDKAAYMASFATKSVEALVIKVADRLCNVQDFLLGAGGARYAVEYWDKAAALFDAAHKRSDEIVAMFGKQVAVEMFYDYAGLRDKIQVCRSVLVDDSEHRED